jgi:hypothetical protein
MTTAASAREMVLMGALRIYSDEELGVRIEVQAWSAA